MERRPANVGVKTHNENNDNNSNNNNDNDNNNHVMLPARIFLTLSRHFSLSLIASGRSSELSSLGEDNFSFLTRHLISRERLVLPLYDFLFLLIQ